MKYFDYEELAYSLVYRYEIENGLNSARKLVDTLHGNTIWGSFVYDEFAKFRHGAEFPDEDTPIDYRDARDCYGDFDRVGEEFVNLDDDEIDEYMLACYLDMCFM